MKGVRSRLIFSEFTLISTKKPIGGSPELWVALKYKRGGSSTHKVNGEVCLSDTQDIANFEKLD